MTIAREETARRRPWKLLERLRRTSHDRTALPDPRDVGTAFGPAPVDIAPNDPLLPYLRSTAQPVDLADLKLDSEAVEALRHAGVRIVVPLVAQGELIGMLNLGERLSEQEYSGEDRRLLEQLAGQAAPALRVAQLVRQQEAEARLRERFQQEMKVAQLIQQNFLPRQAPSRPGWRLDAFYQPAREVGGDFYDFIEFDDGRIGLVVGDVTDKGVPAALVMASTRSVLRAAAQRLVSPGEVLERVNEQLVPDIPQNMFVTCLYGVLEPTTGRFRFANAGHNLPCVQTADGAEEIRATGMPLGLMSGMTYEENEVRVSSGRSLLLYSDALPEAHDPDGEMFGFPRLIEVTSEGAAGADLIDRILEAMDAFTGEDWEEEDDITIVVVHHDETAARTVSTDEEPVDEPTDERELAAFTVPSVSGHERDAMQRVTTAIEALSLRDDQLESLRTAVSEAVMNAIEHGNAERADLRVDVRVATDGRELRVQVSDHRAGGPLPRDRQEPDLEAKLRGEQDARGWGLFLIENMVDEMRVSERDERRTVELVVRLEAENDG